MTFLKVRAEPEVEILEARSVKCVCAECRPGKAGEIPIRFVCMGPRRSMIPQP
jgi:hypothetical protein